MSGPFGKAMVATLRVLAQVIGTLAVVAIKVFVEYLNWLAGTIDGASRNIAGFVDNFLTGFRFLSTEVPAFIQKMVDGVARWLTGKLFDVLKGVIEKVKFVSDAFFRLYDAVVGNSYVPDMVEGIAHWMAKLDAGMVQPAMGATDATRSAFETLRDDVAAIMDGLLTDQERAARELARQTAIIRAAVADPRQGVSAALGAQLEGGVAAEGMTTGPAIGPLNPMANGLDIAAAMRGGVEASRDAFDDAANAFADSFAQGMGRVLDGDIKGLFNDLLRDVMGDALRGLGRSIFGAMGGGKSGGGGGFWGTVLGAMKVPGFKTGGSFKVGGSGGADSQLMQFRATPGEMVNIRRPGQDMGGATVVRVEASPYFDARVQKVARPVAQQAGFQSFGAARNQVPADERRRQRFNLSGAV
jgi:hypothetical protein